MSKKALWQEKCEKVNRPLWFGGRYSYKIILIQRVGERVGNKIYKSTRVIYTQCGKRANNTKCSEAQPLLQSSNGGNDIAAISWSCNCHDHYFSTYYFI